MKNIIHYFDHEKTNLIIYITAGCLFILISINYYISATSVISGTWHILLPSQNYISKAISGINYNKYIRNNIVGDTIVPGDFLTSINFNGVDTIKNPEKTIQGRSTTDYYILTVLKKSRLSYLMVKDEDKTYPLTLDTVIVSAAYVNGDHIRFLESGVIIGMKEKGGATDRAGLLAGDVILSMNDVKILPPKHQYSKASTELFRIIRSHKAGEKVRYVFLRDGQLLSTDVYMAVIGIRLEALCGLVTGILFYILGLFYIISRPKIIGARMVGVSLLVFGFTLLASYMVNPTGYNLFFTVMAYLNNASFMFLMPLILHSLLFFPDYKFDLIKRKWILIVNYLLCFIIVSAFTIWFIIDYDKINYLAFFYAEIAQFLYPVFIISWYYLHKKDRGEGKKHIMVYLSLVIVFLGLFSKHILYLLGFSVPESFNYDLIITVILPFVYFYSTLRHKIFGIKAKIKRSLQYSLLTYFWKILLFICFIIFLYNLMYLQIQFPIINISSTKIEILQETLDTKSNLVMEKLLVTLIGILSLYGTFRLQKAVQNYIDRKFYREKKDYKLLQTELIDVLNKKFTIESLSRILLEKLVDLIHLKSAGIIFIKDEKLIWDDKIYFSDGHKYSATGIEVSEDVISSLRQFDDIVNIDYLSDSASGILPLGSVEKVILIKANDKFLGILFIGEKLSETPLNGEDSEFLVSLISNIAVAIDNTFLYEQLSQQERMKQELEIARALQLATLPDKIPNIDGLDIYAKSIPALEVGGDFYDFLNGNPNELTVIIGDVSGKGTSSALYMSKIQGILQTLYEFKLSPRDLLIKANKLLYRHIMSNSFITVLEGKFDINNNLLQVVRAGHLPLFYFDSQSGVVKKSCPRGIGLGLSGDDIFENSIEELTFKIKKGDIFLFISDGIVESINIDGEQFDEERLSDVLTKNCLKKSYDIGEEIIKELSVFTENALQFDDITLVVVKIDQKNE